MTNEDAIAKLQERLGGIGAIEPLQYDSPEFEGWRRDTSLAIEKIFADDGGSHKAEFDRLYLSVVVTSSNTIRTMRNLAYQRYLRLAKTHLTSLITEIRDWGLPTANTRRTATIDQEEPISAHPPELLRNILWVKLNWKKYWWLLLLALILICMPSAKEFACNKEAKEPSVDSSTSGNMSPATSTTGPNSPVTNIYNLTEGQNVTNSAGHAEPRKVQLTLRAICDDIDSRPLAQQDETAKGYYGLLINGERLRIYVVEINQGDPNVYNLELTFPEKRTSTTSHWVTQCVVARDKYPELHIAQKGMDILVSGKIETAFRTFGDLYSKCVVLSDVTLQFE